MNWFKRFIVRVVLENVTITVDQHGKPALTWRIRRSF